MNYNHNEGIKVVIDIASTSIFGLNKTLFLYNRLIKMKHAVEENLFNDLTYLLKECQRAAARNMYLRVSSPLKNCAMAKSVTKRMY